ncbi:MAG: Mu transposase C-terminal domain-containing protein [Candidatus Cloacimonetes bacterium]|nr:Mu transposase C-terminal domain-containing protein [Candidatus Cloacimonadota bacterium]
MDEAQLFAQFLEAAENILDAAETKGTAWKQITRSYNDKSLAPELYKLKGKRSERALREWLSKWHESGRDMFALVHQNTDAQRGRKVTEFEQDYLLALLLDGPKISIGSAIGNLKHDTHMGLCDSPSSESTLKRWIADWRAQNPDEWAQARKGSKYVKDNIVKSIIRDTSMLIPGDVLVADGHILAFDTINPHTGKPARLTLILIIDWASRYPIGASLVLTESSEHILVAVRNAIMHLGFLPRFIYLDNGKGFKSKLFHDRWEEHDLNADFAGIFPRLGIQAQFAEAYNARAKVIERFFRSLQEQFERFQKTFRGRNIDDKPAQYSRNEKWAKKMQSGKPLLLEEALDMVYYYFRHVYGMRPHPGLNGQKPYEVFAARAIDPQRTISPEKLNFMMLKAERKKLRSEGIWLNKCRYWHENFVKHIGQPVIIRYDYSDLRWILVYDLTGRFIAQAPMREAQHGFIAIEMDNPIARQSLVQELSETRRLRKQIEKNTAQTMKRAQRNVAAVIKKTQYIKDAVMDEISQNNPTFRQPPMISPPIDQESANEVVAKILQKTAKTKDIQIAEPKGNSFTDALKRRGIGGI